MTNKKNTKKKRIPPFIKYMSVTLVILSIILLGIIFIINVLPLDYFITLGCIFVVVDGILIALMYSKKSRLVSFFIAFILLILYVLGIVYALSTFGFLGNITKVSSVHNFEVVVLNDSNYNNIGDLKNKDILVGENVLSKAVEMLKEEINFNKEEKFSLEDMASALLNEEVDALLLQESENDILKEHYNNYEKEIKVIYTFSVKAKEEVTAKNIDVTNSSFNILVSGIDTYGSIGSLSRSDVNMVVTVNPVTKEIVLTSIPRDFYVDLYGKNAKDKLAHAGIYGMDTVVKTIEDLLDIEINYYVKFNFTSLIDIVDAVGPIEVESDVAFVADYYDEPADKWVKISFNKGINKLDGREALAFARERKSFALGDIKRAEHQQLIIKAILDKVLSPSIIVKYNSILNTLDDTFITNMDKDRITGFIKMEIKDGGNYKISNVILQGESSYEYTFSYPGTKLYVMIPIEDKINDGKNEISRVYYNKE